jgi:hypothetical protein
MNVYKQFDYYSTQTVIEMSKHFKEKWLLSSKDYDDDNKDRPIDRL